MSRTVHFLISETYTQVSSDINIPYSGLCLDTVAVYSLLCALYIYLLEV
jgi:hypothetical protein